MEELYIERVRYYLLVKDKEWTYKIAMSSVVSEFIYVYRCEDRAMFYCPTVMDTCSILADLCVLKNSKLRDFIHELKYGESE